MYIIPFLKDTIHVSNTPNKAFNIVVCNFLFPFLNFYDNFICLIGIALNSIHSKNENKWSPFWTLYPLLVILQYFPLFMFLYVVAFATKVIAHTFQW